MKQELADVQAGFRKSRGTRDKIATVSTVPPSICHELMGSLDHWKSESSRKTSISALLTMPNLWLCGSQ